MLQAARTGRIRELAAFSLHLRGALRDISAMATILRLRGFEIHQGFLDRAAQEALVADLRAVLAAAPLVQPVTPRGRPATPAPEGSWRSI